MDPSLDSTNLKFMVMFRKYRQFMLHLLKNVFGGGGDNGKLIA